MAPQKLVKIDCASHLLGRPVPHIFDLVDGGTKSEVGLLWVFNLALDPTRRRRMLRFWSPELDARSEGDAGRFQGKTIHWVIAQILPPARQNFRAGEVGKLFQISPRTRLDYGAQLPGCRQPAGNIYTRRALEIFLVARWVGAFQKQITP